MKKPAKLLILIACGLLVAVFFSPLWHIELRAPQYPEGLDMYIWINQITGTTEFTLNNINILNHYIGMKEIKPDSFKELDIMPYVVIFFIVMGIITAFASSRKLLIAWLAVMIVGGTIGLVDFYMWQQAFGNELDPNAAIKIEGMTYSPPFIGSKTLLNINATSYPYWGGLFFGLALALAFWALIRDIIKKKHKNIRRKMETTAVAASVLLLISSCQPQAKPIEYGFDSCNHCRMTITDSRYGAQLVTTKGKVYKFDAIECMVEYKKSSTDEYALQLVTNFPEPGTFIDAQSASYLQSRNLPSPMGMNLNAFEKEADAKSFLESVGGEIISWEETNLLSMKNIK